jgi:8-oxo-dGTP pyrophosphatase MutT (NUDIX family)
MSQPVIPRPAATITIVRDAPPGFEVLMMKRSMNAGFMAGAYVFPGGGVDREDLDPRLYALCSGIDDAQASRRLGVERDGLAYWVGAIRECFEEAGLLLCYDRDGVLVALDSTARQAHFESLREQLNAGRLSFVDFCQGEGLRLAADRMVYFSHWITPVGAPRRYDTRFFACVAPSAQEPLHDEKELVDTVWVRPHEALERAQAGTLSLRTPTIATLRELGACADCASLMHTLSAPREIKAILPAISGDGGRLLPGDPGYAEAARNPAPKWT